MQEAARVDDYPAVGDIVFRMGEMLDRLHWGGYDGRDVVINIIDFIQV